MLGTIGFISFIGFSLGFLRVRLVVGVPVSRHVGVWGTRQLGISSHRHKPDRAPILKIRAKLKIPAANLNERVKGFGQVFG